MKNLPLILMLVMSPLLAQRDERPRRVESPETLHLEGGARVEFLSFDSEALGKEARYSIYFPPGYDSGDSDYPVLYFLHGLWNDHTSWTVDRYGNIPERIENLMVSGRIPPFLIVQPDAENSFYTDYLDGSRLYEKMVAEELVALVEARYRTLSDPGNRAIGGVSMGGYGALKIAMKHPDQFASVAGISPIVFGGEDPSVHIRESSSRLARYLVSALEPVYGMPFDSEHWRENSLEHLAREGNLNGIRIFLGFGSADRYNQIFPLEAGVRRLSRILDDREIDHVFKVYENGPHGWQLVVQQLEEVAIFLSRTFERP